MDMTDCRRAAPPHGYTLYGVEGRYFAARLYPRTMGSVLGGGSEGVECINKRRRQRIKPAVPEEQQPWRHPILRAIRLLATIMQ